jgi:AAA+ ATPase superfamily predicted ATPase
MGTVNFVGRERELEFFSDFLTAGDKENGVFVVIGERGIGKTALMKEIYTHVKQSGDELIGFYRLFGKTATQTPFVEVLADLLFTLEEEEKAKGKTTFKHIGATIVEVFRERKSGLTKSVLKDVAKNLKFDETVNFLEQIWEETKEIPVIELAEETIAQHKQEFIAFYLDLLGALARKTNKRIVLMIDQFELATITSVDLFMSLVRGLPQGVYLVASFKKGEEPRHYEAIEPDLRYEGSRIVELNGLSEDEIGGWIRKERGIDLLKPELKKIRRASGAFPSF